MPSPQPSSALRTLWLVVAWLGVAAVVFYSLKPHPPQLGIENGDKVQHFAAYAGLMLWWVQLADALPQRLRTAAGLVLLGVAMEVAQGFTGYREASVLDALANTAGVLAGWLLAPPRLPNFLGIARSVFAAR